MKNVKILSTKQFNDNVSFIIHKAHIFNYFRLFDQCLTELMMLRLKDNPNESEKLRQENLESKLEAPNRNILKKNREKFELTLCELEVYELCCWKTCCSDSYLVFLKSSVQSQKGNGDLSHDARKRGFGVSDQV